MENLLEGAVRSIFRELRAKDPAFCTCKQCEDDVLAYALNNSRPRYSGGSPTGSALVSVELQRDQTRASLAVLILDAMRKVASNPDHSSVKARPPKS